MRRGAIDFLEKPFTRQQFLTVLARVQRFRQGFAGVGSADLAPHLLGLAGDGGPSAPWRAAGHAFDEASAALTTQ